MLCGDFILPEPASYVFFYAIFNLRNLLYIILDLRRGAGHLGLKRATGTFLSALGFEPKRAKK